jgi:hypothetical protein
MNEISRDIGSEVAKRWFSVLVPSAHVAGGGGRTDNHVNYVYACNVIDALNRVRRMRGWKRDIGSNTFPEIRALTDEEIDVLEETITVIPNVSMTQAKKLGFYGRREEK